MKRSRKDREILRAFILFPISVILISVWVLYYSSNLSFMIIISALIIFLYILISKILNIKIVII